MLPFSLLPFCYAIRTAMLLAYRTGIVKNWGMPLYALFYPSQPCDASVRQPEGSTFAPAPGLMKDYVLVTSFWQENTASCRR
ncbi:hypothetical protein ASZ90_015701 [hydrocarbon metagenome]|uniref:Uncharacterized protein n=1 Tax=hydrocarbon metagenome TaxID=938273 RepID=A0A0W8F1C7_9ZZZZ